MQSNAQFNTDEHSRVEFLTPVYKRDEKMIKGKVLKQYFTDVLFNLPMNSARLQGTNRKTPYVEGRPKH